jgi:DNA-binding CsgD family transcriptional regulator
MKNTKSSDNPCVDGCVVGSAMEGMCVGLVVMNPAGRIQWMNRAAGSSLGLDPGDCAGRRLASLIQDPRLSEFWHQALESSGNVLGEVSLTIPREAELKLSATRKLGPSGEIDGRVLLFCDVTAEKAIQLSLSRIATEKVLDMAGQVHASPLEGLTPQEIKILRLVGKGQGNEEIATGLHVAVSTVRSHMKSIYRKMEFTGRSEAIAFAVRNHIS